MPTPIRFDPPDAPAPRAVAGAFYRVEKHERDGTVRHFVVHAGVPRLVVEIETTASASSPAVERRGEIRRVCLPNSWAGDYHRSARLLGAAVAFFDAPPGRGSPPSA